MTYIYLNTYLGHSIDYLYVGSHTWNGEGIDPSYVGSSSVAKRYGWIPDKVEILEVVEDGKLGRERYWIEKYAEEYGIADCVLLKSEWVNKYKRHGSLLNGHSNECSQMMSHEIQLKAVETKRKTGELKLSIRRLLDSDRSACYTEEAMKKRVETSFKKGTKCYSKEVYERRAKTINVNKSDKNFKKTKYVRASKDGEILCEGILHRVCVELGHPTWDTTIVQKFKKGKIAIHRGITFEWLNKI